MCHTMTDILQDDKEEGETGLLNVLDRIRTLNQDRVQFFAQLATLIPTVRASPLQDNDEDINIPVSRQFWRRVLQWLVTRNKWRGVYCLFNPREIQPEDRQWSPLHGRAIGFSVDDVRVCDLLQSTNSEDLRTWGICLAIWLLKQGARIELISSAEGESVTIAAVKTSLNAGMSELLCYVMEIRPELTLSLDDADQSGDSPLHLCVKFQQPDAESGAAVVLQTLLDLGCCTSVKDRQFRTPIQYVEEPDERYTMLSHAANHAGTGLKDRFWKMKKLGDDHFQKDEFETSLSWYKKALVLAESAPNMKMELALLHSSCSCVYANLAVLEDKDLPTSSSQMCKELCERKDLAAVLSNIKNPDVTPNKEGASEDKEGQEEKSDDDETEDDVNDDMKSDESRDERLQNNAQAIQKELDLLKIEVRAERFEDEEEISNESLLFDSDVTIYERTQESDVVLTTEAFEKAPSLLKNDLASKEEQYGNENEGDRYQATHLFVNKDDMDHLSGVGIAESLKNLAHVIHEEQRLLKNIETSIEENIHCDNERTDRPSPIRGHLSLPTGASKNTYVLGELQEDDENTDTELTHTSSPEEAQECGNNFVIYVEKGSGNSKETQDSFGESTLLNHSDCMIMFEVDHDNKQIMIHDQPFVSPGVSSPEQTANDVEKNSDLSETRILSPVDHDSRASDGHYKQNEPDSSDQLWRTDDMITVSNTLQETDLTEFKGGKENTELYKETDGKQENENLDAIPTAKADDHGNNQFTGTVGKDGQMAEEPARKDEQVSGDTAGKDEQASGDTADKDEHASGHTTSMYEQVSGDTASKDEHVSGDTASMDELVSEDTTSKNELVSKDTASMGELVSGDTASKDEQASGHTASMDEQVSGDTASMDNLVSGDTASMDGQVSGHTAGKDELASGHTASKDEQASGHTACKDEQASGDTASMDELVSGDTTSKDEQVSGDTARKDEQVSGDTASKDEQASGDTASMDELVSGDTTSKDEQVSGDTASMYEQMSGDTASKDEQVSKDTASMDELVSEDTTSKDEQVSGDTASKDKHQTRKTDTEDDEQSEDKAGNGRKLSEKSTENDENKSEDSDSLFENMSNLKDGQLENQSMETYRSNEIFIAESIQRSEPGVKDEEKEIIKENKSRATGKEEGVSTETTPQKEKTERVNEEKPGNEDIEIENWSEVSDNDDRGVMSFLAGHKTEDTAIPNAAAHQVSKSASTPFAIDNDKMTPTKKKRRKTKKKTSKPLPTVGQSLEGNTMQIEKQDLNEAISNPKKKYAQEKAQHQAYQMKEKTISDCTRSINEAIQDPSSPLFKEKGLETESITIDSSEVVQEDQTDDINEMVIDNYEELANIDTESFDEATWEIECTANAWKQLKENTVPMSLRQQIIKYVQQLAFGAWKNVPRRKLHGTRETYATKVVKSLNVYMVWEIAVAFSGRCSDDPDRRLQGKSSHITGGRVYTEIIRIWGIVFSEQDMLALAESISKSHIRAEDCILKKRLKILDERKYEIETKRRIPRQFSEVKNDEEGKTIQLSPPASPHKTEYHILKFYVFSSALVNILLHADTKRVDLPFKVTHREHAIIHLQSETPILLLGRSGTGKTTCCLYRLWNNFISYWQIQEGNPFLPRIDYLFKSRQDAEDEGEESSDENHGEVDAKIAVDGEVCDRDAGDEVDVDADAEEEDDYGEYDNLHQMFVTKNPVLCHEVKKNFLEFCSAHEETLEHVEAATTDIPATLQEVSDLSYPLFLTSKKLLLMLDASLGPPHFFARNDDGSLKMKVDGWEDASEENTLLLHPDSDDEDEFAEVDYRHAAEHEQFPQPVRRKQDPRKEVTYDVFVDKVWPKMQKKIGVKYHPSLVWTEMISFIMGSQDALFEPKGYLSEAQYMEIGKKRAPNFSGDRSKVYQLFQRYVQYKTQHQMFDEADFVRHIFQRLNKMPELPWVLHQLYVDETQDFTQSELSVLLRITQDPNKMFLTGDTAQGIMRGISFRFCDLKSLFHQTKTSLEEYQRRNLNEPKEVYQLIHSYRSHVGILSLASSVLELMVEFFPESFDRLKKDQGLFHGPKPILLESCSVEDLMVLMQGNNRDTSHIEFGAHQAILVVNQDAKTSLPDILYNNSIVLTIFESKGLEFDDVLLYNFFTDSEASKEWRVVTQYLESLSKQDKLREDLDNVQKIDHEMLRQPHRPRALDFDPTQHKVLNSELKNLYTALTRARVNVWLFDEDEDKRAPMFEYFKARKLVRSVSVSDRRGHNSDFQEMVFAMKSSESDWVKRGDEMMAKSLYDTAAKCYEMGFEIEKRNLALAHSQAQRAKKMRDSPREMKEAFIHAADMFFQCREALKASQCLQNAQEFGLAAKTYFKMGKLLDAAKMFQRARNFTKACECLIGINQYGNAVHMLDKAELFEQAINCLKQYEEKLKMITREGKAIPQGLIENKPQVQEKDLWWKLIKSLHSQRKEKEMLKALRNLSREEHLEYLEKHKYYREAAELMLEDGKTGQTDAAEMLLGHGMFKLALEYAEKGNDSDIQAKCHEILALDMISSYESEMKDNQDVREKIVNHLKQAKTAFQRADNKNGVAMSVYHLSKLTRRIWDAKDAYELFQAVKPLPNYVGMIESWRIVVESIKKHYFQDCKNLILNINVLLSVIKTLLEQSDATQRNMYKMYMQFYGLHENVLEPNSLLVHPKQSPLCADIIPNFYKKNERREKLVSRDKETMSFQISLYLGNILCQFNDIYKKWLHPIAIKSLQCRSFVEGRSLGLGNTCANGNCQQLHEPYNKSSARTALEIMSWRVNLEANVSEGVLDILDIASKSKERMQELRKNLPEKSFDVCTEFLDFVMSSQRYTGWFSDSKKSIGPASMKSVKRHVRNFLKSQKGKTLEEKCGSVDWIVREFTFNALYGLEIDMHKECCNVEEQVKHDKKCLIKEKQLAFLCMHRGKESLVELIGTIFLDSCENLQRNVEKAVFDYTKYVKVLGDRNRLLNFPKWPLFFFWHETFLTVALVTLTKMSKGSNSVIPSSYLQTLSAVDDCFPTSKIQQIINDTEMNQSISAQFQGRVERFAGVLCGYKTKMNLLNAVFKVGNVKPPNFLHFERCLVLALVIMANADWFSSVQDELMKVVKTFEILECLPRRLKNALEASQNAKGITDIVSTLKQLLQNRENEQLFCCKWMWKPTQKVGIDKEEIKSFEMFSTTFQSVVKDEEKYTELDVEVETTVDETEEEDLRLADDFEKRFQEQRCYQQEKLMDKSARTIQRFFRKITFRAILETRKLIERCKRKEVEEFLIPYQVTETMCGICSVALLKDRNESLEPSKLHTDENILEDPSKDAVSCQSIAMMLMHGDDMDETLEESGEKEEVENVDKEGLKEGEKQHHEENLETHETHVSSQQHQVNSRNYTAFKELYEEYFLLQVPEVHRFVTSLRNEQLFIANPQEQLRTFDYMIDVVSFLLTSILRDRKWFLVFDLRSKVIPLYLYYRKASEEAEMWKQHLMQFHQQPYYQGPSDEQTSGEMQPAMAYGGTSQSYHEETLDGFDLVNVEYQPSVGSFVQHDDNPIYQQDHIVYDRQNLVDEPVENRERNRHGRIRGQEYRRHGDRRGKNRGRGREWGRQPRGNEERRDGQPRIYRGGGGRQPWGNGGRERGRGRGQRGARGHPNLPPRLQNQQLQMYNERIYNPNAF